MEFHCKILLVTLNDARFRIKQPNEYSGPARKEFGIPRKDECTTH